MSNPLDNKKFKHFLNFKNDDVGMIQISEPLKFDAAEFIIEQDSSGYARDISIMSSEISLEFYKGFYEMGEDEYMLPNGVITKNLGHCLEWLLEYNKNYGFESEVDYILERNGVQFVVGELNFESADTDELTYFIAKVVQNTQRAIVKRREDTKIDVFSDKDIDGNPIQPLETFNVLLKSKPIAQESEWTDAGDIISSLSRVSYFNGSQGTIRQAANNAVRTVKYGINNSLNFLSTTVAQPGSSDRTNIESFAFVEAREDLSNVKVTINTKDNRSYQSARPFFDTYVGSGSGRVRLVLLIGDYHDSIDQQITIWEKQYQYENSLSQPNTYSEYFDVPEQFDINLPFVGRDKRIYIFYSSYSEAEFENVPGDGNTLASYTVGVQIKNLTINIQAESTSVDTVIKAVRYIDLAKQSLKAINGMELYAPAFEQGGKYYDLFACSGNLIRRRDDVPYYVTFKDRKNNLALINGDIQINEDEAFALQYDDFYSNKDNGSFIIAPDSTFKTTYNKKHTVNTIEVGFKTFETDRDEENTLDSVHTQAQFVVRNKKVQNTKKIEVDDIFDTFSLETQKRLSIKETTALDGDDKTYGLDVVPLAPNVVKTFSAKMSHYINEDGFLQLLNDNSYNWSFLGFSVDSTFHILTTTNAGVYTVESIYNNILVLSGGNPTNLETQGTQVKYTLDNVQYTNRTNEGFDLIENILTPNKFANLRFTIKRILSHWERNISTFASYISENVVNSEFKNNGELVTQFNGGPIYKENGDIVLDEINKGRVTPKQIDTNVIADYDSVLDLINKYQTKEGVGGFIRVIGNNDEVKKIYPEKLSYNWSTEKLNIIGEERRESDILKVYRENDVIFIDEVGYEQDELSEVFFQSNNDYFILLDKNNIKLINFTKYDRFEVQGQTFTDSVSLAQALILL